MRLQFRKRGGGVGRVEPLYGVGDDLDALAGGEQSGGGEFDAYLRHHSVDDVPLGAEALEEWADGGRGKEVGGLLLEDVWLDERAWRRACGAAGRRDDAVRRPVENSGSLLRVRVTVETRGMPLETARSD